MQLRIKRFAIVNSTNQVACEWARAGEPEGLAVVAGYQTEGRGRMGRTWISPKDKGLLISILMRPRGSTEICKELYALGTESVAATLCAISGLEFETDEPNDVVRKGKKVAGVLVESATTGKRVDWAVLGVGINVNTQADELPPEATSLRLETGKIHAPDEVLRILTKEIAQRYAPYEAIRS